MGFEGYTPQRYESASGGGGGGGSSKPPAESIPPGMVRAHLVAADGKEMDIIAPPADIQRITNQFYGQSTPTETAQQAPAQSTTATEPSRGEPAPSPRTRTTKTSKATRAQPPTTQSAPNATRTTPATQAAPVEPLTTPARQPTTRGPGRITLSPPTVPEQPPIVEGDTDIEIDQLPQQPGWRQRLSERFVAVGGRRRFTGTNVIAAGILGAFLAAGAVGLTWAIQESTPPEESLSRIGIPIGQCQDVPGNSIAIGYFMSIDNVVYNPEKDPNQGVVVALNSPARVCTSTSDKQPTLVEVVGNGQDSLYTRFVQDITNMQDNGCINNAGCRRVITATK